jgi:hypothetical protein
MKPTRVLALAVTCALGLGLAACSDDGSGLPSVGGSAQTSASADSEDLVASAKTFHDCLQDAGLPVDFQNDLDNLPTIVKFADNVSAVYIVPAGYYGMSTNASQDDIEEVMDLAEGVDHPEPMLKVDGVDYTADWVRCHDESGYDETLVVQSALQSPTVMEIWRKYADASNEWAACARENGWPEVKDAVINANTGKTEAPMALLPPTISETQLRALLEVCPNFDLEQAEKNAELLQEMAANPSDDVRLPDGYVMEPLVGFDYPGFDGKDINLVTGEGPDIPANETTDQLYKLQTIVNEASTEFYSSNVLGGSAASSAPA